MQINMNIVLCSIIFLLSFSLLVQNSFAIEETGNMDLLLKYTNGNKADINSIILKVYKDSEKIPLREISAQSNPISITDLPLGHKYKIEVYYNDHFQSVNYYDLEKTMNNFEITLKLSGGIKLGIFYKDGQTPIPKANILFKTLGGKIVGHDETDINGDTIRFWLPQTIDNDYYSVDIIIDPALKFTYTPLKIQSFLSKDIKIVTTWPKIIDSLISIQVYKDKIAKVSKADGNFIVQIINEKRIKIMESPVSYKGDATISNIPVGTYTFHIIAKDDGKLLASKRVTLSGSHEPIKLFINDPQLTLGGLYCNCVAFRFDDVQDYFLSTAQIEMIELFEEMDTSLTVGIIGGATGKDSTIIETIKEQLQTNPGFEIASHSWNNNIITSVSPEKQEKYIKDTDDKIYELFQVKPRVFIPPENLFDGKTITFLKKYGYDHISADTDAEISPKFVKSDFYYFHTTAWTAKLDPATGYWKQLSKDRTMEQIKESLLNYGYAVVMMHPFEFSNYVDGAYVNEVNQTKFTELKSIISDLKSKGYLLTTVGKIDKYDSETFQNSVKNQTISKESIKLNCNCIAFKIDNIEDYWLNDVQNNLIDTFSSNKLPVTVSILGKFFGTDPKVIDFLKQQTHDKNNQISVAIGGWENVDHSSYNMKEQASSIQQTNKQINAILGIDSNIFSPPLGKFNNNTLDVLKQNKISYISTTITTDQPNFKSTPIHIPVTSYISNLLDDDPSINGTIVEKMLKNIQAQQEQYGYAIVSMQPPDFAVKEDEFKNQINEQRIQLLEELISHLKENNIKIVSISDIPQEILFEKYPMWIKQIYVWHKQGQITDIELDNAINNLISKMIIKSR